MMRKNRREVVCDTSVILVMIICTQHSKCIFVTKWGGDIIMRAYNKITSLIVGVAVTAMMLQGCGSTSKAESIQGVAADAGADSSEGAAENAVAEGLEAPYFTRGVYVNYAKGVENPTMEEFYVFMDEKYGHTDNGVTGAGEPFDVVQNDDGTVNFYFGGKNESEDVFTVTSCENDIVTGSFEDGKEVVFEPVFMPKLAVEPEDFSAENYLNGPEHSVYHDANGWSVNYDADKFNVTHENGQVFFVYTGESSGTNMITVSYIPEVTGEKAIKELGESWGNDSVTYAKRDYLGGEEVATYSASFPPSEDGSGLYMEALGIDHMEGALVFELTGHNGNDEALDMEASDNLALIIDSFTFD